MTPEMTQFTKLVLYNNQFILCYWEREREKERRPKAGYISQALLIFPVSNGLWVIIEQPFETAFMKIQYAERELRIVQKQFADTSIFSFVF